MWIPTQFLKFESCFIPKLNLIKFIISSPDVRKKGQERIYIINEPKQRTNSNFRRAATFFPSIYQSLSLIGKLEGVTLGFSRFLTEIQEILNSVNILNMATCLKNRSGTRVRWQPFIARDFSLQFVHLYQSKQKLLQHRYRKDVRNPVKLI